MKKNIISILIFGLLLVLSLTIGILNLSQEKHDESDALNAANQLYLAGNVQEAKLIYEQLVEQGIRNDTIFYNLGNAYLSEGDTGRAILNYQRAAQISPRDVQIKTNLSIARQTSQVLDHTNLNNNNGFILEIANKSRGWFSTNETAIIALSLWFFLGFLLLIRQSLRIGKYKSILQYTFGIVFINVLLFSFLLSSQVYSARNYPAAVVVVPSVALSSSPGEEHATEMNLSNGMEINVVETNGNWIRLFIPNDKYQEGWIPSNSVEIINNKSFELGQFVL